MEKKYLNEENFQNINTKIKSKGRLITNITLCIGIGLILTGIILLVNGKDKSNDISNNEEITKNGIEQKIEAKEQEIKNEKNNLKEKLNTVKSELESKKQALLARGIKESSNYNDGEAYDLYILDNVLSPSFDHCWFDQYNQNEMTKDYCTLRNLINGDDHYYTCEENEVIEKYCSLKAELVDLRNEKISSNTSNLISNVTNRRSALAIPCIIVGVFISFASLVAKFMVFTITHRREIMAYTTQQVMPVAKEGIEDIAPTIGNVGKELAKGIKEGLNDDEKNK